MKKNLFSVIVFLLTMITVSNSYTADYGEIVGTVTDKETGEPLPFANLMVLNTSIGAAADENGKYRISQIPAGTYSVVAKFVGYNSVTIENVRVSLNRITNLSFELGSESLKLEDVVVQATRPAVDVEVASSAKMITSDDIKNMPVVTNVKDLVALQSGVVKDGENIHIRGGRSDEVLYLIDGVPARNPITGVASVEIDVNQIEEVEILTGGFDAEYGNANSGVINIITKTGREKLTMDAVLKTDAVFGNSVSTNFDYTYIGLNGPVPFLPNSGFTLSTHLEMDDTYYKIGGGYGTTNLLGININDKQYGNYGVMAQVHYQPWKDFRIKLQGQFDRNSNKSYNWTWSKIPESLPITKGESNRFNMIIGHTLSKDSYYNLSASYQRGESQTSLLDMNSPVDAFKYVSVYYDYNGNRIPNNQIDDILANNPSIIDFSKTRSEYRRPPLTNDFDSDGFVDEGIYQNFYKNSYQTFDVDFDYTHFIGVHKIKSGFELSYQKVNQLEIENLGVYFPYRDTIPGPNPEYGTTRWFYDDDIWNGAFYVQDRIEYAGMFLNLGIRGDIFRHGEIINDQDFIEQFNRATGKEIDAFDKIKLVWSPRVGLSIPADKDTKLFFNYGYFIQSPSFRELYRDPFLTSVVGNPDLDPRKSINYEVGMETEFIKNYVLNIKLYGRDNSGDIGFRQTETVPARSIYENIGFGSSRGFEIEFRKVYSDFFSLTANYTYLLARGFDLTALDAYELGNTIPPSVREQRVGWDKNHTFKLLANFEVMENDELNIFGMPLTDFGIYFLLQGAAGRPYTPIIPGAIYIEANSKDGPGEFYVDATMHKGFNFLGIRTVVFLEAKNIFGIQNINFGSGFNARTGDVYNVGDLEGQSQKYLTQHQIEFLRANAAYTSDLNLRLGFKVYVK
jgi:outer membrane receptor protein involved in Fe transport